MEKVMTDMWKALPTEPTFRIVQNKDFGVPKKEQYKVLQDVSKAHVESFNFMLREGLSKAALNIQPMEIELPNKERIKVQIKDCTIGVPVVHKDSVHVRTYKVYPSECRARGVTYRGKLLITVSWSKNDILQDCVERAVGEVPVMVKSNICNLNKLTPAQLIDKGEEEEEFGGYFVINGNERIVRMLIMQRRNYPIAMSRPSWKNRGEMFTEYGISIRCVRSDQSGANMVLHYLSDGSAQLMFPYRKELFFVPIMFVMKALCDVSDHHIYKEVIKGKEDDHFFKTSITTMLRTLQDENLFTHNQVKNYIGEKFRVRIDLPSWYTNVQVAEYLLKDCICVHLDSNVDKFNLIALMIRKLFAVAKNECALESPDNPMNQELLLPGHLYTVIIKEKLESWLYYLRTYMDRKMKGKEDGSFRVTPAFMNECFSSSMDLTRPVEYVFATGNFISRTGAGLMQFSGLTVVADKLNFWRYISHFRCVHRGSFFAEMRTTAVRKLLPESWGFICPVHTPDGSPCGLLNHMTAICQVSNTRPSTTGLQQALVAFGMLPVNVPLPTAAKDCYPVLLDGRIVGWVPKDSAESLVSKLRCSKALGKEQIPSMTEICLVPITGVNSQYPGIFIFTTPARMMRPVKNLSTQTIELIGTMEQVYLHIIIKPSEAIEGLTSHQELRSTSMLSILANFIPYSDFNQSPRNMYECQMGKQTMGTPCLAYRKRSDNKLYRIQTPQSPLVRPAIYDFYHMDDFPLGTNAVVAVISYTGYDMEDAMILNKSSLERGFKHGSIYKSEFVNLRSISGERGSYVAYVFGRKDTDTHLAEFLDMDGLPYVGVKVNFEDPICSYIDIATNETKVQKYHSTESAYVLDVKLLGNDSGTDVLQKICITFWIPRNPIIGDKFASRHGQKGICSMKFPMEDMPFTESGMTPDILFNPHGFPSRMTIGMMIESMAGKSAALHGVAHDSTPFRFSEKDTANDYFGKLLVAAGYNYYGTEKMYSGTSGNELEADIFVGIVYYQRLRHMVADKYQVRTTGPIDILTHQPVQGRKRCGGIRFGEMERDSLLAHGASFLLHDRLFNCSDGTIAYVCMKCESILSPLLEKPPPENLPTSQVVRRDWTCKSCDSKKHIDIIGVPYVFRYLAAELAGINIKMKLKVT